MNPTDFVLNYFYRIMWCEFSNKDTLTEDHIISLIGMVGLNSLHNYGRLKTCGERDGTKFYMLDKSYI